MESKSKYLKKPKHRFPTGSRPSVRKNRSASSLRLNITGSLDNKKNEAFARKLEGERIHSIMKAKKSAKKSVKKSTPRNNGLPRPHTHSSVSSRSITPVYSNMYNLMEKGTSRYRPSRSARINHRMPTIQENVESSISVKRTPTTFSEYFQNVANEAHEESRKLNAQRNAEKRFGNYFSSLGNEIAAENEAERMEHERVKSERNQLKRNEKEKKNVKYSVKAHRELLDSYMPVHQIFNRVPRAPTHKGRKSHR
jgi:hypothetical protein